MTKGNTRAQTRWEVAVTQPKLNVPYGKERRVFNVKKMEFR